MFDKNPGPLGVCFGAAVVSRSRHAGGTRHLLIEEFLAVLVHTSLWDYDGGNSRFVLLLLHHHLKLVCVAAGCRESIASRHSRLPRCACITSVQLLQNKMNLHRLLWFLNRIRLQSFIRGILLQRLHIKAIKSYFRGVLMRSMAPKQNDKNWLSHYFSCVAQL